MSEIWVTTKGGDKGETSLGDGTRVPKDSIRVEAYGTLDECQAALGLARASCCSPEIAVELLRLESELGGVMGYLALYPGLPEPDPSSLETIVEKVRILTEGRFTFVRPGDSLPGAALHLARTVARRAERLAVKLHRAGELPPSAYAYINRLSDAIYALALWTDKVNRDCEAQRRDGA